jgi:RimJ/RimL family protein N-acetyltransferase
MPLPISPLETSRLLLRPLCLDDAEQIQDIFPHWEVVQYMAATIPWPYPSDGALTYIRDSALPAMECGREWHWTLRLRTDPAQIIGCASLRAEIGHNRGFWLGAAWQRKGLMSEAAEAITDYWFEVLGFDVLRVSKAEDNIGSRRISERSGMRCVGIHERAYVGGQYASEYWEITATEWKARRSSSV